MRRQVWSQLAVVLTILALIAAPAMAQKKKSQPIKIGLLYSLSGLAAVYTQGTVIGHEIAAEEINAFSPDAQIIVMLRDPVEVMHSLHAELVFYRAEQIESFAEALAAEGDRKRGRRLGPPGRAEMRRPCRRSPRTGPACACR